MPAAVKEHDLSRAFALDAAVQVQQQRESASEALCEEVGLAL